MEFWKAQMPEGMLIRSPWSASNLSDPDASCALEAYRAETGEIPRPIPLDRFVQYGLWFQRQAVGEVDRRRVVRIEPGPKGFAVTLSDDETLTAGRVVVASGIGPFASRPTVFNNL